MTALEHQVAVARRRLWLNRWLRYFFWAVAGGSALFALAVLVQRLWALSIPLQLAAGIIGGAVLIGSIVWLAIARENAAIAAARLDEAAGLRERISSGRYCVGVEDPFARAVVADAERISSSISARQHIRLSVPPSLGWAACSLLVAALMFLVPWGIMKRTDARETADGAALAETKIAVKRELDAIRRMAEETPALSDFKAELEKLDQDIGTRFERPGDLRHEAVKKIDALADALKQKKLNSEQESMQTLRQELRGLRMPDSRDAPTEKLTQSLRQGDFKSAREEVEKLKEQLATMKSETDREAVEKLSKQLDELSKQLESVAAQEKLAEKLEQAGVKKEDVAKALESLKKDDLEQLKKQLEESGANPQQAEKLARQLQQQKQAGSMAQKLAQSMKAGAKCNNPGQAGEAMAGLSQAGDQLSELEQLQQEMDQINSSLQALNEARDGMGEPSSGQGGKSSGEQSRGGMGEQPQRGEGGVAPEEKASYAFKVERGKVHTGKGAVVGQFEVEGEQVRGEATAQLVEVVAASERDASDRIQRDRIPRQYHKAVKSYFSNVRRALESAGNPSEDKNRSGAQSGEEPSGTAEKPETARP